MYSKTKVKSYGRETSPKRSYKRNVLPPGVTELTQSLLGSKVMGDASDLFRRGKKSKLAKALRGKHNRGKNPEPISAEVEDMSKEWHGREVQDYQTIKETETFERDLVNLGDLEELGVLELGLITFKKDQPTLCCDGEGHNLEIVGGDQHLDLDKEGIEFGGKRLIPLGYIYSIVYVTDKHHIEGSNGYPEPYEHYFAEEFYKESLNPDKFKEMSEWFEELEDMGVVDRAVGEGRLPLAVYDKTDEKIIISGGGYEVTDLGIKD